MGRQDPYDLWRPARRVFHRRGRVHGQGGRDARGRGRCDRSRHNGGHQCGSDPLRPADRPSGDRRLQGRALYPRRAPLRHVRSADRICRADRAARPDLGNIGTHPSRRLYRHGSRRSTDIGAGAGDEEQGRRRRRHLPAQCLCQRRQRTPHPRHPDGTRTRPVRVDLVGSRAADSRIPARGDHSLECIYSTDYRALPDAAVTGT